MRRTRSMLIPVRGKIRKRAETGSDLAELLKRREKEVDAFRANGLSLPQWDIGARIPALFPGERINVADDAALTSKYRDITRSRFEATIREAVKRELSQREVSACAAIRPEKTRTRLSPCRLIRSFRALARPLLPKNREMPLPGYPDGDESR